MQKVKLMTDSTSDISYADEQRYDITIVPIKLEMGGRTFVSRVDFDNDRFYELMEESGCIPVTSQVIPYEFSEYFERFYGEGYSEIINVNMNSLGSATHDNAVIAARDFFLAHPEAEGRFRIRNIDSGTYSGSLGYAVTEAAKLLEAGVASDEVVSFIEDWCARSAIYFAPYTLKYVAKSGRITVITAQMGDLLGIKPILMLSERKITAEGKARGEKKVVPEVVRMALSAIEPGAPYCILYGNDRSVADAAAALMTENLGYPPANRYQIGAAIAANAGPRVVGVLFRMKMQEK